MKRLLCLLLLLPALHGYAQTPTYMIPRANLAIRGGDDAEWMALLGMLVQKPASLSIGDLLYYDGTTINRLPKGATGQVLRLSGTSLAWQYPSTAGTPTVTKGPGNG